MVRLLSSHFLASLPIRLALLFVLNLRRLLPDIAIVFDVLDSRLVNIFELEKQFLDLSQRFDLNVLGLPVKEILSNLLLFVLLLWGIRFIVDPSSIGEGVVHSQLLLQLPDILFVLL